MSTFSFSCPQCGKAYDNVKAKMAGRKVSCTCGKVFRLGPKTEEQMAADAARQARKLAKQQSNCQLTTRPAETQTQPSAVRSVASKPVQAKSLKAEVVEAQPVKTKPRKTQLAAQPVGEIFEAIEVEPPPVQAPLIEPRIDPTAFEQDPLLGMPPHELYAHPLAQDSAATHATPVYTGPLAVPAPYRKPTPKKSYYRSAKPREPMGGAIWTVVFAFPAALIEFLAAASFMGTRSFGRSALVVIIAKLVGFIWFALAVCILISGIVAIIELVKGERIGWPTMVAGIAGGIAIFANIILCGLSLVGLSKGGGGASAMGKLFLYFIVICTIPIIAAITGFVRNQPDR